MRVCKCCGRGSEPYGFCSEWNDAPWSEEKQKARREELEKVYEIVDVDAYHESASNMVCVTCLESGCKCGGRDLVETSQPLISSGPIAGIAIETPVPYNIKLEELLQRVKSIQKMLEQLLYGFPKNEEHEIEIPDNEKESITDLPLPENGDLLPPEDWDFPLS